MGYDEARPSDFVLGQGAVGGGVGDVGACVVCRVALGQSIVVGDAADVQVGRHGGGVGGGGGHTYALGLGHREARLFGGAAIPKGARGVDYAIGNGIAVIVTAHVDVGFREPSVGQEQRQGCVGMVADTVVDHVVVFRCNE